MNWLRNLGPGLLVTAAFIGPGTLTTASKAGADFGFALVWALLFSIFATIVLQEMCARLGLVTRQGLGESIRTMCKNPVARILASGLVIAALALGNAAFQTGNILGAASGLETVTGVAPQVWTLAVGVGAFLLLACGAYKILERVLIDHVLINNSADNHIPTDKATVFRPSDSTPAGLGEDRQLSFGMNRSISPSLNTILSQQRVCVCTTSHTMNLSSLKATKSSTS